MFSHGDLIGRYRVLREIQKGSSSTVYLLIDHNQSFFAGKVILRTEMEAKNLTQNIEQEIRIHSTLHHPNIAELRDVIYLKDCIVLVTDYYETDLYSYLDNFKEASYLIANRIFTQLIEVIQYLENNGIAHCDIKPENILVDKMLTIKLCDFGSCESIKMPKRIQSGSLPYIPPEVATGKVHDFRKWDVWSAGIVTYLALFGRLPWISETPEALTKEIVTKEVEIPADVLSGNFFIALRQCLTKDPKLRPLASELIKNPLFGKTQNFTSSTTHTYSSIRNSSSVHRKPLIIKPKSSLAFNYHFRLVQ